MNFANKPRRAAARYLRESETDHIVHDRGREDGRNKDLLCNLTDWRRGVGNAPEGRSRSGLHNYPPLKSLGYQVVRADKIDESGTITTQIIQKLISADLVVADLSDRNPNVFYELSVRHASRKPFIQIITAGESIPFDVAANRTIPYDLTKLEVVESAKAQIEKQVTAIESGGDEVENPISTAIDLSSLRASASPSDRTLGDLLETLTEVGAKVARMDQVLSSRNSGKDIDRLKAENHRLSALLSHYMDEIGRLRAIKGKINYHSLNHAFELEPVLDSLSAILKHIREHNLPNWDEDDQKQVDADLEEIIQKMELLSFTVAEIPF